ncbi:alpha-L-fucosidase [Rubrivirga sp. IMCC45206]|uniref:alpha-L-fucosidase n=1 Tax=Rubrivirga sp. IMCC45206 TaxID=3391614 RepID=UPI00399037E2
MRAPLLLLALVLASCSGDTPLGPDPLPPPAAPPPVFASAPIPPVYPVPSPAQLRFQRMETNVFIHFGINTFTNTEWGDGTDDPALFNPTALDATQWLRIFKETGFNGVLLVAKHVDGFHLWPTPLSDYTVAQSPWRGGDGDLVREVAEATRAAGLELGLYLAPWDRRHPDWGTPRYNDYFVAAIKDIMGWDNTGIGSLYQVWFDYGHDQTIVTPEQLETYDRFRWIREVRLHQPGAVIAPEWDAFFPGNEDGVAPETNWSVRDDFNLWAPFECDVTLRSVRSWYWHPQDDPKPLDDLVEIYFTSVGRGCVLTLAVAPDQRGLIDPEDEDRLREWRAALDAMFDDDLARHAAVTASSVRPGSDGWAAGAAVDGDPDSFWAAEADTGWIEVDLGAPQTANVLELAEPIRYGQRIGAFRLEAWDGTRWQTVAEATTVNYKRLLRFPPVTARRWRVVVDEARAAPALSQVGLYDASAWAPVWAARGSR